jgi:hypothetical protein
LGCHELKVGEKKVGIGAFGTPEAQHCHPPSFWIALIWFRCLR